MRCGMLADRVTGIAYHLAGVEHIVPDYDNLAAQFEKACADYGLVLISGPLAARLPAGVLQMAIHRASPPVQIIAPVYSGKRKSMVANLARRALGVSE
jgi:vacuolar-type H+-ATPase subunit F/Vma7